MLKDTGLRWLWLSILVMLLDFSSKEWVVKHLTFGDIVPLMPVMNFFYIYNFGIVFGIFNDITIDKQWFLILISIFIIILLLIMMYHLNCCFVIVGISYAMIVGGGLGNLLDRIFRGVVIDFIDIHIHNWHFPVFNFADIAIFFGFLLIIFDVLLDYIKYDI